MHFNKYLVFQTFYTNICYFVGRNNSNIVGADQINLSSHVMNEACEDKMFLCMNYDRDEMKVADKRNVCFAFGTSI